MPPGVKWVADPGWASMYRRRVHPKPPGVISRSAGGYTPDTPDPPYPRVPIHSSPRRQTESQNARSNQTLDPSLDEIPPFPPHPQTWRRRRPPTRQEGIPHSIEPASPRPHPLPRTAAGEDGGQVPSTGPPNPLLPVLRPTGIYWVVLLLSTGKKDARRRQQELLVSFTSFCSRRP